MHSEELDASHVALRARFRGLHAMRGGAPVYALEHGLGNTELRRLRIACGSMLRLYGVSPWWTDRGLPLIVLATEVGYRYRGTGTDFWPVLSARLGAAFTDRDREGLTTLFQRAHRTDGLKQPAPTAWNLAFRHIAWPISNAVAPVEIHRPLARALYRMFRRPPAQFEGADLAAALRRAAVSDGAPRRLTQWLEDDQLAAAMSARLLDLPEDGFLDPAVVSRIWSDMSGDAPTRQSLGHARAEHRKLQAGGRATTRYGPAHFALRVADGKALLHLVPPPLAPEDYDRLVRHIQGRRARLWDAASAIDLQSLCEGRSIPLDLERLPDGTDAFLLDSALAGLDGSVIATLRGLSPDLAAPLLFPVSEAAVAQTAIVRPDSARRWRLIAHRHASLPEGVTAIGRIGDADLLEIDTDNASARAWLEARGFAVERGPVLEPVLARILDQHPQGVDLPEGLPALFRVVGPADGTTASVGKLDTPLGLDRPFLLVEDDAPGDYVVRLRSAWPDTACGWRRSSSPAQSAPPLSVAIDADEITIEALLGGELSVQVTAAPGLSTPALRIAVVAGGAEIACVRTATDGARFFGGGGPMLLGLANQLRATPPFERGELVVELEGVSRDWWPLSRRLRTAQWERREDIWTPLLDGTPAATVQISAETPTKKPQETDASLGTVLLLPVTDDGLILEAEGLVIGPRSFSLGYSSDDDELRSLFRRWDAAGENGLQATAAAWVRWSCASTANLILEVVRARAVHHLERMAVRQLCGRTWSALEDRLTASASSFWGVLAEVVIERGMAAGDGFPSLPEAHRDSLRACLAYRLETSAPRLRTAPTSEIEDGASTLDEAINEAWEDHFQALERGGASFHLEDECDAYSAGDVWASAVREADDRHQLGPLCRLVLPQARGRALCTLSYESTNLSSLAALLEEEHTDLRPRGPPRWLGEADIRRGLMFWTDPRGFSVEGEGEDTLIRLLADRQTSRAIRYAALRRALSRGRLGVPR